MKGVSEYMPTFSKKWRNTLTVLLVAGLLTTTACGGKSEENTSTPSSPIVMQKDDGPLKKYDQEVTMSVFSATGDTIKYAADESVDNNWNTKFMKEVLN